MSTNKTSVVSGQANRLNVKNLVYAILGVDTKETCVYGGIKKMASAMQIVITPKLSTGTLYGDGELQEDHAKLTGLEVQLDVNKIPIEVRADMFGVTLKNGVFVEGDYPEIPYMALGYEVEESHGNKEVVWLLKAKAQPYAQTVKQSESNLNFSTDSIKLSCFKRKYDKQLRAFGDTAYPGFTSEMADVFFDKVPVMFNEWLENVAEGEEETT